MLSSSDDDYIIVGLLDGVVQFCILVRSSYGGDRCILNSVLEVEDFGIVYGRFL